MISPIILSYRLGAVNDFHWETNWYSNMEQQAKKYLTTPFIAIVKTQSWQFSIHERNFFQDIISI